MNVKKHAEDPLKETGKQCGEKKGKVQNVKLGDIVNFIDVDGSSTIVRVVDIDGEDIDVDTYVYCWTAKKENLLVVSEEEAKIYRKRFQNIEEFFKEFDSKFLGFYVDDFTYIVNFNKDVMTQKIQKCYDLQGGFNLDIESASLRASDLLRHQIANEIHSLGNLFNGDNHGEKFVYFSNTKKDAVGKAQQMWKIIDANCRKYLDSICCKKPDLHEVRSCIIVRKRILDEQLETSTVKENVKEIKWYSSYADNEYNQG